MHTSWTKWLFIALAFVGISTGYSHWCKHEQNLPGAFNAARDSVQLKVSKVSGPPVIIDWPLLATTKFVPTWVDSLNQEIAMPQFADTLKRLEGKLVQLKGFVIPVSETGDSQVLVLSANPYSSCFFCGAAGPESIADIQLRNPEKVRKFGTDERVTFQGTLHLNDQDLRYFNFMLLDATLLE